MVNPLARDAYCAALYQHMYRVAPLLERVDGELELALAKGDRIAAHALETMRSISVYGLFDVDFYCATYRDVPQSDFEAVEHYVRCGEAEGRKPNVAFSPHYYRKQAMAEAAPDANALQHYGAEGERAGRKPSLGFDPRAYLEAHPTLAAFVDRPLFHFLKLGLPAGLAVRPRASAQSASLLDAGDSGIEPRERAHRQALAEELKRLEQAPAPPPSGRNLVMGLALGYRKRELAPFVRSLRASGYDGEIVLWVSGLDSDTRRFLDDERVRCEVYWEMRFVPFHFMLARNFSYYRYLRTLAQQGRSFDRILLSDVGDVVFQGDPFANAPEDDLVVFLEDAVRTLDSCYVDSYWVRSAFGEGALDRVRARRMSCAGTVLGTGTGILRYLLVMQLGAFECALPARLIEGIDQAVHNVMLYRGHLAEPRIAGNLEQVFTMGIVPPHKVVITPEGKITDLSGRIAPIVHQYNRHPAVTKFVHERYGSQ